MNFKKYIQNTKDQLNCNASEEYKNNYITYTYSNEQVETNLSYFEKCMNSGLSPYTSLLFFHDYLNGEYII